MPTLKEINEYIKTFAEQNEGRPYEFGAKNRKKGAVDCSGLTQELFENLKKDLGVNFNLKDSSAAGQLSDSSVLKNLRDLRPGDFIGLDADDRKGRGKSGIDHIAVVYEDEKNEGLMVLEAKGGKGTQRISATDFFKRAASLGAGVFIGRPKGLEAVEGKRSKPIIVLPKDEDTKRHQFGEGSARSPRLIFKDKPVAEDARSHFIGAPVKLTNIPIQEQEDKHHQYREVLLEESPVNINNREPIKQVSTNIFRRMKESLPKPVDVPVSEKPDELDLETTVPLIGAPSLRNIPSLGADTVSTPSFSRPEEEYDGDITIQQQKESPLFSKLKDTPIMADTLRQQFPVNEPKEEEKNTFSFLDDSPVSLTQESPSAKIDTTAIDVTPPDPLSFLDDSAVVINQPKEKLSPMGSGMPGEPGIETVETGPVYQYGPQPKVGLPDMFMGGLGEGLTDITPGKAQSLAASQQQRELNTSIEAIDKTFEPESISEKAMYLAGETLGFTVGLVAGLKPAKMALGLAWKIPAVKAALKWAEKKELKADALRWSLGTKTMRDKLMRTPAATVKALQEGFGIEAIHLASRMTAGALDETRELKPGEEIVKFAENEAFWGLFGLAPLAGGAVYRMGGKQAIEGAKATAKITKATLTPAVKRLGTAHDWLAGVSKIQQMEEAAGIRTGLEEFQTFNEAKSTLRRNRFTGNREEFASKGGWETVAKIDVMNKQLEMLYANGDITQETYQFGIERLRTAPFDKEVVTSVVEDVSRDVMDVVQGRAVRNMVDTGLLPKMLETAIRGRTDKEISQIVRESGFGPSITRIFMGLDRIVGIDVFQAAKTDATKQMFDQALAGSPEAEKAVRAFFDATGVVNAARWFRRGEGEVSYEAWWKNELKGHSKWFRDLTEELDYAALSGTEARRKAEAQLNRESLRKPIIEETTSLFSKIAENKKEQNIQKLAAGVGPALQDALKVQAEQELERMTKFNRMKGRTGKFRDYAEQEAESERLGAEIGQDLRRKLGIAADETQTYKSFKDIPRTDATIPGVRPSAALPTKETLRVDTKTVSELDKAPLTEKIGLSKKVAEPKPPAGKELVDVGSTQRRKVIPKEVLRELLPPQVDVPENIFAELVPIVSSIVDTKAAQNIEVLASDVSRALETVLAQKSPQELKLLSETTSKALTVIPGQETKPEIAKLAEDVGRALNEAINKRTQLLLPSKSVIDQEVKETTRVTAEFTKGHRKLAEEIGIVGDESLLERAGKQEEDILKQLDELDETLPFDEAIGLNEDEYSAIVELVAQKGKEAVPEIKDVLKESGKLKEGMEEALDEIAKDKPFRGGTYADELEAELILWHGSLGKKEPFDAFKSEFINTGEGTQFEGWGHYFTTGENIVDTQYRNLGIELLIGNTTPDVGSIYDVFTLRRLLPYALPIQERKMLDKIKTEFDDFLKKPTKEKLKSMAEEVYATNTKEGKRIFDLIIKETKDYEKVQDLDPINFKVYIEKLNEDLGRVTNTIPKLEKLLKELETGKFYVKKNADVKYRVAIRRHDGQPMEWLVWHEIVPNKQIYRIRKAIEELRPMGLTEDLNEQLSNKIATGERLYKALQYEFRDDVIQNFKKGGDAPPWLLALLEKQEGSTLKEKLTTHQMLDAIDREAQKRASLFLDSIGINGTKYPSGTMGKAGKAGTGEWNYVVYNDKNIKILSNSSPKFFSETPGYEEINFFKLLDEFGISVDEFKSRFGIANPQDLFTDNPLVMTPRMADDLLSFYRFMVQEERFVPTITQKRYEEGLQKQIMVRDLLTNLNRDSKHTFFTKEEKNDFIEQFIDKMGRKEATRFVNEFDTHLRTIRAQLENTYKNSGKKLTPESWMSTLSDASLRLESDLIRFRSEIKGAETAEGKVLSKWDMFFDTLRKGAPKTREGKIDLSSPKAGQMFSEFVDKEWLMRTSNEMAKGVPIRDITEWRAVSYQLLMNPLMQKLARGQVAVSLIGSKAGAKTFEKATNVSLKSLKGELLPKPFAGRIWSEKNEGIIDNILNTANFAFALPLSISMDEDNNLHTTPGEILPYMLPFALLALGRSGAGKDFLKGFMEKAYGKMFKNTIEKDITKLSKGALESFRKVAEEFYGLKDDIKVLGIDLETGAKAYAAEEAAAAVPGMKQFSGQLTTEESLARIAAYKEPIPMENAREFVANLSFEDNAALAKELLTNPDQVLAAMEQGAFMQQMFSGKSNIKGKDTVAWMRKFLVPALVQQQHPEFAVMYEAMRKVGQESVQRHFAIYDMTPTFRKLFRDTKTMEEFNKIMQRKSDVALKIKQKGISPESEEAKSLIAQARITSDALLAENKQARRKINSPQLIQAVKEAEEVTKFIDSKLTAENLLTPKTREAWETFIHLARDPKRYRVNVWAPRASGDGEEIIHSEFFGYFPFARASKEKIASVFRNQYKYQEGGVWTNPVTGGAINNPHTEVIDTWANKSERMFDKPTKSITELYGQAKADFEHESFAKGEVLTPGKHGANQAEQRAYTKIMGRAGDEQHKPVIGVIQGRKKALKERAKNIYERLKEGSPVTEKEITTRGEYITGYKTNYWENMMNYINWFSTHDSQKNAANTLADAFEKFLKTPVSGGQSILQAKPDLVDWAERWMYDMLNTYVKDPIQDTTINTMRGVMFFNYLGLNLGSPILNATQIFTSVWPRLSEEARKLGIGISAIRYGKTPTSVLKEIVSATRDLTINLAKNGKDVWQFDKLNFKAGWNLTEDEAAFMNKQVRSGDLSALISIEKAFVPEMGTHSATWNWSKRIAKGVSLGAFYFAEAANRQITTLTAYRIYRKAYTKQMAEAATKEEKAQVQRLIEESAATFNRLTNYEYNPANQQEFSRMWKRTLSPLMMFKTFSSNYFSNMIYYAKNPGFSSSRDVAWKIGEDGLKKLEITQGKEGMTGELLKSVYALMLLGGGLAVPGYKSVNALQKGVRHKLGEENPEDLSTMITDSETAHYFYKNLSHLFGTDTPEEYLAQIANETLTHGAPYAISTLGERIPVIPNIGDWSLKLNPALRLSDLSDVAGPFSDFYKTGKIAVDALRDKKPGNAFWDAWLSGDIYRAILEYFPLVPQGLTNLYTFYRERYNSPLGLTTASGVVDKSTGQVYYPSAEASFYKAAGIQHTERSKYQELKKEIKDRSANIADTKQRFYQRIRFANNQGNMEEVFNIFDEIREYNLKTMDDFRDKGDAPWDKLIYAEDLSRAMGYEVKPSTKELPAIENIRKKIGVK